MKKRIAELALCSGAALLLSACAHDGLPPGFSKELRPEAKLRKKQCDAMERSFRPSVDNSGQLKILGFSIGGRKAVGNLNSVSDQHLVALNNLLLACRDWQYFKIKPREFRRAQAEFGAVMRSGLSDLDAQQRLKALAQALQEAEDGQVATRDKIDDRFDELNNLVSNMPDSDTEQPQLIDRIASLEAKLDILLNGQPDSVNTTFLCKDGWLTRPNYSWKIQFETGSAQPMNADIAEVKTYLETSTIARTEYRLSIVGYADVRGNPTSNLRLAKRRANATALALKVDGIKIKTSAAVGETEEFGDQFSDNRIALVNLGEKCLLEN